MTPQERFVAYLQEHPGFYLAAKSDLYITILSLLEKEAVDEETLSVKLPGIDQSDLGLMVKSLVSLKLVGVLKTNNKVIYYITGNAKEFLSLYKSTKTGFGTL